MAARTGLPATRALAKEAKDRLAADTPLTLSTIELLLKVLSVSSTVNEDALAQVMVSRLKDTSFLVADTGAKPGDVLRLEFRNFEGDPNERVLIVRIRVVDVGWNRAITDSAFFLHRRGISRSENESVINQAQNDAMMTGMPQQVETPEPINYEPAAGVTLAWTYVGRRTWLYDDTIGAWPRFLYALRPSFGFNVSFMQFGSRVTTFTPSDPMDPTSAPFATFQSDTDEIDVGAGAVFGMFDNALQVTYGWNLNEPSDRVYVGIGLSFVSIARKIDGGD